MDKTKQILGDIAKKVQEFLFNEMDALNYYKEEERYEARVLARNVNRNTAKLILLNAAPIFISPYDDEWHEKLSYYTNYADRRSTEKIFPTIHTFMKWYCDSDTIQKEVDFARKSRKLEP